MNLKQAKLMRKWCKECWNGSPESDRSKFKTYKEFENKVKNDVKKNDKLLEFFKSQLKEIEQ